MSWVRSPSFAPFLRLHPSIYLSGAIGQGAGQRVSFNFDAALKDDIPIPYNKEADISASDRWIGLLQSLTKRRGDVTVNATTFPPEGKFPGPDVPLIYADGVLNASFSTEVTKFLLFRFDPSLHGDNHFQTVACAQIAMSIGGFVSTVLYLSQQMEIQIKKGAISQGTVDEFRRILQAANP